MLSSTSYRVASIWQIFKKLFREEPESFSEGDKQIKYEAAVTDLQARFNNILEEAASRVVSKSKEIVGNRFDFKYFIYRLVNETKTWPPLDSNSRIALEIAQALINGFGTHPNLVRMSIPEHQLEQEVDNTFKELSVWVQRVLGPHLQKEYLNAALSGGKKVVQLLKEPNFDISAPQAALVLSEDFEKRLKTGQLRFPTARLMNRVIRHLFV